MTTQAHTSTSIPQQGSAGTTWHLDPAVRVGLYDTMVLARTYEEAILREYHADKGPRVRHRKRPHPRRDAPVGRPGACRRRGMRTPLRRRRRHRDAPATPPGHRPWHGPAEDDRGDLRSRGRSRSGPGRPHAPVRPRHSRLLLGHHRRGVPAGVGPGLRVPPERDRPHRGGCHRGGRRQPGCLPRVVEPRGPVVAPRRFRRGGQRLGHLGTSLGIHGRRLERGPRCGVRHSR